MYMNAGKYWSHDNNGFDSHSEVLAYVLDCKKVKHKYMLNCDKFNFDSLSKSPKSKFKRNSIYEFYFEMLINRAVEIHCSNYGRPYLWLAVCIDNIDDKHLQSIDFYNSQFIKEVYDGVVEGTYSAFISDINPEVKEISKFYFGIDLNKLNSFIDVKSFFKKSKITVYKRDNRLYTTLLFYQLDSRKLHEKELSYMHSLYSEKSFV